jgi:signal transduction histidine kinase
MTGQSVGCHRAGAVSLFVFLMMAIVPAFASDIPIVQLRAGESAPPLREYVRYKLAESAVPVYLALEMLDESSLLNVSEPNIEFGLPESPLLVLLKVRNQSDDTGNWIFSTDRGSLRYIEMFDVRGQHTRMQLVDGDLVTQKEMLSDYHAFAFQFSLQPGEERLLGVVFEAESSTKLPLTIMEPREHQSLIDTQLNIVLAATVGTLTLILLNAILFGVTEKREFLYFVIAELALVFQAVHLSGYTTIFWFSEHAELARALSGVAKVVFALFSVRFIRSFLRTRETWPGFERPAKIFENICWLAIVCLFVYPFVPFLTLRLASTFSVVIVALALVALPLIAAVAVKRYGWIYTPLVLGWSVWSIYLIYTILTVYTILPEFPYQWRWMAPLGFFEALMLSIALGLNFRKIQQSEISAQRSLSDALRNRLLLLDTAATANSNRAIVEQQLRETSSLIQSGGHDSRNYTSALKMYGSVIQNSEDIGEARTYGTLISEITAQLDATLDDIVGWAAEDGVLAAGPVRIETIDAKALLDTAKKMHEQAATQAGIRIRCRASVREITGDRHLLIRLLGNLISNAIKYSQRGTVLLVARHTRLEVWDQGSGIEHEQLERLLSPGRMRERLNPIVEGTGSGLGICLDLCEKMCAKLLARSTIGRGSVFKVELCSAFPVDVDEHRGIAILDSPAHWPEDIVDSVRVWGVPIRFIKRFDEVHVSETSVVIVDPALHSRPPDREPGYDIALCSYEVSSANLGEWIMASPVVLAKPVTLGGVLHLLNFLKLSGKGADNLMGIDTLADRNC